MDHINRYKKRNLKKVMVNGLSHIKVNSGEANKDKGFMSLMASGAAITCLSDEEYVVPEEVLDKLRQEGIRFEPVVAENITCSEEEG